MITPPVPIDGARELFSLDPDVAYLNHGSFGAVPIPVQRVQQAVRDEVETNPMRFYVRGALERVRAARREIATHLGADPEGTALIVNVSAGASIVADSVALAAGDEVLVTDHGYGPVTWAAERACREAGARLVTVPLEPGAPDAELVAALVAAVTPRTRFAVVDQITATTALLLPVAEIVAALRERGVAVLVDAAHVPGALPVDVTAIGADFWMGNLHKWAYAPRGTAVLTVAPAWRARIRPNVVSWGEPEGFPASVEHQATRDHSAWLAAPAGLDLLAGLGADRVRAHNAALAAYGQAVLVDALGATGGGSPGLAMRTVWLPEGVADTPERADALRNRIAGELRTEVALNSWRGRGILRLSAQVYNTAAEYEALAATLPGLLR